MKLIISLLILTSNYLFADDISTLKQKCFSGDTYACQNLDRMQATSDNKLERPQQTAIEASPQSEDSSLHKEFSKVTTLCSKLAIETKKETQKEHILSRSDCTGSTIATPLTSWDCKVISNDPKNKICPERQECSIRYRCINETDDYNRTTVLQNFK